MALSIMVKFTKPGRLIAQTSYLGRFKPLKMFGKSFKKSVKVNRRILDLAHCATVQRNTGQCMYCKWNAEPCSDCWLVTVQRKTGEMHGVQVQVQEQCSDCGLATAAVPPPPISLYQHQNHHQHCPCHRHCHHCRCNRINVKTVIIC